MALKKCKIRYKRLIVFLIIVLLIALLVVYLFNIRITNIYVSGNNYLSDQSIIEMAKLENYPRAIITSSHDIESRIGSDSLIESVDVRKKSLTHVYISVLENRPLFYDEIGKHTVLKNGEYTSLLFNVPALSSSINSNIYSEFLEKFSMIDLVVFDNISEVSYVPNDVDNELFLFTMNDGNYIYVNLDKFESVNKYFEMIVKFNNHKGILYLDSGEYFKILDN